MNIQDLRNAVEKAEKADKERYGKLKTMASEYAFYGTQYTWLLDILKRYIDDNSPEIKEGDKRISERISDLLDYYEYHWEQYGWLLDEIQKDITDNNQKFATSGVDNTIDLKLTYHELSNLLELIEDGLIQKGLDSVEDDTKKLYYSLVNTWGENAKEVEDDI